MFQSTAIIKYDQQSDILRANVCGEINRYYKQLFYYSRHYTCEMWTPRYDSHITIYRPKIHGFVSNSPARYDGDLINFKYNPEEIYEGGHSRGFIGFYLPIYSENIDKIKEYLGIIDQPGDSLHLTLFSNKHLIKNQ